jgi:hypothetical protein
MTIGKMGLSSPNWLWGSLNGFEVLELFHFKKMLHRNGQTDTASLSTLFASLSCREALRPMEPAEAQDQRLVIR